MLGNSLMVGTAKSNSPASCKLGVEDLEDRLTLSVTPLPSEPFERPVTVLVVTPSAPTPDNGSVAIAPTDQPVASSPVTSNPQNPGRSPASSGTSSSTNSTGAIQEQLPPQFSVLPLQNQPLLVSTPSTQPVGPLVTAGPGGRPVQAELTNILGATSFTLGTTPEDKAFIVEQDAEEPAPSSSLFPTPNGEPISSVSRTAIDAGSFGKFTPMEDAAAHIAPWVTVLTPTRPGVRSVDGQRLFVEPAVSELPGALQPRSSLVAPEAGTDPLGLGFEPLRSLAPETWVKVDSALPNLDILKDLAEGDRSSVVWQPGMWIIAAATLWAVFPRRNRTLQRSGSESVGIQ